VRAEIRLAFNLADDIHADDAPGHTHHPDIPVFAPENVFIGVLVVNRREIEFTDASAGRATTARLDTGT